MIPRMAIHHPRGSENGNRYSPTGREVLTGITRQLIDVTAPRPDQIDMRDIALSLAQQVRFTGHCPLRPSIAHHSLACEYIVQRLLRANGDAPVPAAKTLAQRAALMHDAAEYLVSDLNGAVKKQIRPELRGVAARNSDRTHGASAFDKLEALAQAAINARFACYDDGFEALVHEADVLSCAYEMAYDGWCADAHPPQWMRVDAELRRIYTRSARSVERAFLKRAAELGMS